MRIKKLELLYVNIKNLDSLKLFFVETRDKIGLKSRVKLWFQKINQSITSFSHCQLQKEFSLAIIYYLPEASLLGKKMFLLIFYHAFQFWIFQVNFFGLQNK